MTAGTDGNGPAGVEAELPALNQIYFYLTQGCNLACRHCWLAPKLDPGGDRYPVLPVEAFETAIREARPLGLSGVKLTGGEPLLHPEIVRLLEIIRREELGLTIETNGVLCMPDLAAEIARSPNPFVSVSLDGADAVTHEWVRGIKGSFDLAVQGVRNLVAAGIRPQIIMSLMHGNVHQVEAVIRLAESLGASSVKFNVIQPTGRGEKIHAGTNGLEVAELIDLGHYVDTKLAKTTVLSLFFDYPMAFRPLSRIAAGDGDGACGILGVLGVIASGHYALCGIGEQVPELVFGTVGADPLDQVWRETAVLKELRAGMPGHLGGLCAGCLMKHRCLGSCVAQNYYRSGNLWQPFWFCEEAGQAGLFPEARLSRPHVS
jgi:SynChlorMet cassette radical SAM/SPASM protein ScmF